VSNDPGRRLLSVARALESPVLESQCSARPALRCRQPQPSLGTATARAHAARRRSTGRHVLAELIDAADVPVRPRGRRFPRSVPISRSGRPDAPERAMVRASRDA
jgi:hypothetical protein